MITYDSFIRLTSLEEIHVEADKLESKGDFKKAEALRRVFRFLPMRVILRKSFEGWEGLTFSSISPQFHSSQVFPFFSMPKFSAEKWVEKYIKKFPGIVYDPFSQECPILIDFGEKFLDQSRNAHFVDPSDPLICCISNSYKDKVVVFWSKGKRKCGMTTFSTNEEAEREAFHRGVLPENIFKLRKA